MKKLLSSLIFTMGMLSALNIQAAGGQGQGMAGHVDETACQMTSEQVLMRTPSDTEAATLSFMREEEKMARDVYKGLFDKWSSPVFLNISESEQKHMDKVEVFLDAYNLPDPVKSEVGQFSNQEIQALYDELISRGSQSILEAFKAGAMIEEIDIDDLRTAVAETDDEQLKAMYTQLMLASHNHLRAFSRQIINLEGKYVAQFMSSEEVAVILDGENAEMNHGNSKLLDAAGEGSENNACFVASISDDQGSVQNGSTINSDETIIVTQQIMANPNDLNQAVDWIVLASYQAENSEQSQFFVRNGESWQVWGGVLDGIPSAGRTQLLEEQALTIFNGQLQGMPGLFSMYSGYRLENGSIVYTRFPIVFKVGDV